MEDTPLIEKYRDAFEKDPRSRVFAPLAEAYRKLGLLTEAISVLNRGLRHHPHYILGNLVLANCYFDRGLFELTYETLRPYVEGARDNIKLLKLFAQVALKLGHQKEAFDIFKYLLFINPHDRASAEMVAKLDGNELTISEVKEQEKQLLNAPAGPLNNSLMEPFEGWVEVALNREQASERIGPISTADQVPVGAKNIEVPEKKNSESEGEWTIAGPQKCPVPVEEQFQTVQFSHREESKKVDVVEKDEKNNEENQFLKIEKALIAPHEEEIVFSISETAKKDYSRRVRFEQKGGPEVFTMTLVDLYLRQGLREKALEILNKLLHLRPDDPKVMAKIQELAIPSPVPSVLDPFLNRSPQSEKEGRDFLLRVIDEKFRDDQFDFDADEEQSGGDKTEEIILPEEISTAKISGDTSLKFGTLQSTLWRFHHKLVEKAQVYEAKKIC